MKTIDYDLTDIPESYDRGRDHGPELLDLWMRTIASHVEGQTISNILDLGCGTGRFSESLAAHFAAEVTGVDPSIRMLAKAEEKRSDGRVNYQQGRSEAIPLPAESVDLVFMSMSFHHFNDPGLAARECRRVLRGQGTVFVRTATREQMDAYPYVPFFPSSRPLLEALLPDLAGVCAPFENAGFHTVACEIVSQTIAPDWAVYAEKLATGADSVLARLSAQEFQDGLAALCDFASRAPGQPIVEPIDLLAFR